MRLLFGFIIIAFGMIQYSKAMEAPRDAQELQQHLLLSADIGDCFEIEKCIQLGADINAIGNASKYESMDWTPLMFAARQEHRHTKVLGGDKLKACRTLVRAGADVNAKAGRFGWTALMVAAGKGNVPVCRLLIENGADLNIVDSEGRTLWDWAVESDQFEVCELLLQSNVDVRKADLTKFIKRNDLEMCTALIKRGASAKGYLLLVMDRHANPALIQLLLASGASVTEKITYHDLDANILHVAASQNREYICQILVNHQKQVNAGFVVGLLCLKQLKNEGNACAALLYRERRALLIPFLDIVNYVPIKKLLSLKDREGRRPYDYTHVNCLNPDLEDKSPLYESDNGWSQYCTIQ